MSNMPIEDAAHRATEGKHVDDSQHDVSIQPVRVPGFMSDLLAAQHEFINAQFQFTQDADFTKLLGAQSKFIQAQSNSLANVGVYGDQAGG